MSIHKVTNIFVGNGSALEADVNTLTVGKLGLFNSNQAILASAYSAGGAADSIQFSETYSDGTFKKSMWINGRSVVSARAEAYKPATREVWALGYNRKTATGSIEVNNDSDYTASIRFKNDKSLYSERPEVLRINFISSATASQLSIATQAAAIINNGGFKTLISAIVVGDGTGVYGLTGATNYGVEITAKDIEQFQSSTYKENRVYFSVHVDDSTGFGTTTTCTQIVANSYGTGTYNQVYNKENFEYQYEGLSNRRLWPAQTPKLKVSSTAILSGATGVNVSGTISEDKVTFAADISGFIRVGELVELDGANYEVKYMNAAGTSVWLTTPLSATITAGDKAKVRCFYSVIVLTFADNTFTSGADVQALAQKSIYVATPAINTAAAWTTSAAASLTTSSTEGASLISKLNTWLASTPAAPATLAF